MRSLKILHVLRAPIGGLFRHVVDLVHGQIARGHQVGIVADSSTGNARSREIFAGLAPLLALGLTLTPVHRPFGPQDLPAAWQITKRVRKTEPDVIHGHGAKGGAFARLALAAKPAIRAYTPHGGSLLLDHTSFTGKAYLALERMLMWRGDLYLFESAYSARIFDGKIGQPVGLVRVVHNGVAGNEFAPVTLADHATDLVFLGEFRPVKGIDLLIDAIASLHRGGAHVTATLVGEGPDMASLSAQVARTELTGFIRFAPPMPARAAMALGRIMVIPSRAESLPYVVLEAASAGKPLITTSVGGIPEIYGPLSPVLVPPGDVTVLAAAIASALADPDAMVEITRKLRAQVAAAFSADAMVDGVIAGYEQAIRRVPALSRALPAQA
ncbi:MAG: glycosyltransferase family 4 protein [Rhizobiales bacterium]|nr:glycosyltransferase family 4 protein [Hyphomicrobiales bacterium]